MSAENRVEVGPAADFEDGDAELVQVGRVEVGVIKADGEFHALRNECPHDGGPVCKGQVEPRLVGEWGGSGERVEQHYDDDQQIISCPWHGWSFDVETGRHIGDDRHAIPKYDVVVENGVVYVKDE